MIRAGEIGADEVELVVDAQAAIGEGPVWDDREQVLYWVDILGCRVHRYDPGSRRNDSFDAGQPVGAVGIRASGGRVLAVRDGFAVTEAGSDRVEMVAAVEADKTANRMNDGKCDSVGRFWAGTMAFGATPGAGALYRLDADFSVTRVVSGVTVSNGMDWSLDGHTMYYIDSPTRRVDAFDYNAAGGEISKRRLVLELPAGGGEPDGMTLDAEGFLWVALYGGGAVHRYSPAGRLDLVVRLPVSLVTSCAFGGSDLGDLYITSANEPRPAAGGLFRCRPGIRGRPAGRFAG